MPLPQRWNQKRKKPPVGFDYVEPVLEALEAELRDVVQERDPKKRKTQAMWPVHQINWQKSRYIYDLYYIHKRIDRKVYQYCIDQKLVDAGLIAKWKKTGYERLCSTYVINPVNYKFGTTSICRVPWNDRSEEQKGVHDPTTGCLGCASRGGGPRNIFGNKYGQHLAAVQIAREERIERKRLLQEKQQQEEEARLVAEAARQSRGDDDDGEAPTDDDDASTDDEDDDDFGPSPAAGIWAGSQKLERQSEQLTYPDEEPQNEDDDSEEEGPAPKRVKT